MCRRYGANWAPQRGGSGGGAAKIEFDGVTEYITEAYTSSSTYIDRLTFKTNLGRTLGADPASIANVNVAHPCPVGQFRLAYMAAGPEASTGYLESIALYWVPISSAAVAATGVEVFIDQNICTSVPSPPPMAFPPPPPPPPSNTSVSIG